MPDSTKLSLNEGVVLHKTSFRGLSVVNDKIVWGSGSRGTVAHSTDGGESFVYTQIRGYEKSDFRDIEAFDENHAVIMSSGTPAYILKTSDGGISWKEVYKNINASYFLDAMDFWDEKKGLIVGDPINGHFVLLQTNDGGENWVELDTTLTPKALAGEAAFAASGTSLRCWKNGCAGFVTGGSQSRFVLTDKKGCSNLSPQYFLPIQSGAEAKGAFSFCVSTKDFIKITIVGGDYAADTLVQKNGCRSVIKASGRGCEFVAFEREYDVKGYRSCIEMIKQDAVLVACGSSGVDIGTNKWVTISKEPFHVVRKAKKGKAVFLAGPKGKIGKLVGDF